MNLWLLFALIFGLTGFYFLVRAIVTDVENSTILGIKILGNNDKAQTEYYRNVFLNYWKWVSYALVMVIISLVFMGVNYLTDGGR